MFVSSRAGSHHLIWGSLCTTAVQPSKQNKYFWWDDSAGHKVHFFSNTPLGWDLFSPWHRFKGSHFKLEDTIPWCCLKFPQWKCFICKKFHRDIQNWRSLFWWASKYSRNTMLPLMPICISQLICCDVSWLHIFLFICCWLCCSRGRGGRSINLQVSGEAV